MGWAWTDQTPLGFLNWAPGEPNLAFHPGSAVEENCVEMYADGLWNDNNCLQRRGFVCRHHQCELRLPWISRAHDAVLFFNSNTSSLPQSTPPTITGMRCFPRLPPTQTVSIFFQLKRCGFINRTGERAANVSPTVGRLGRSAQIPPHPQVCEQLSAGFCFPPQMGG